MGIHSLYNVEVRSKLTLRELVEKVEEAVGGEVESVMLVSRTQCGKTKTTASAAVKEAPLPVEAERTNETPWQDSESEPEKTEEKQDEPAADQELDANGDPWDPEIHSANGKKNADGTWRLRRGAKKKVEDPPESDGDEEGSKDEPAAEKPQTVDKERVRAAFQALNEAQGLQACRDVMQRFGASSVSALDEGKYPEVVKLAEHVTRGGEL